MYRMYRAWKRFAVVSALVLCLGMPSGVVFGQGKGGGGGGGKPPKDDPPAANPLELHLTWIGTFGGSSGRVADMNSLGVAVGSARAADGNSYAFRLVPAVDGDGNLAYWEDAGGDGINDLLEDLNFVMNVPAGWRAYDGRGISDGGMIAGNMVHEASGIRHVYVYDPATGSFVDITPDVPGDAGTIAGINNNGDVAGDYDDESGQSHGFLYTAGEFIDLGLVAKQPNDLNNSGQITGLTGTRNGAFRYTPSYDPTTGLFVGGTLETFPSTNSGWGINDAGVFVGQDDSGSSGKPFRYIGGVEVLSNANGFAYGVNALNDVCGRVTGGKGKAPDGLFLYTDTHGLLLLDDLVVGSAADVDQWMNSSSFDVRMTHEPAVLADGSLFSPMYGSSGSQPFVLMPVAVE